jgi:hypothetical protein
MIPPIEIVGKIYNPVLDSGDMMIIPEDGNFTQCLLQEALSPIPEGSVVKITIEVL